MDLKSNCQLALKNLFHNKVRSFLTMIGIIVGVASVITIVSIMDAAKTDLLNGFDEFYTTQLTLDLYDDPESNIPIDELRKFVNDNTNIISSFSPVFTLSDITISINGNKDETNIAGVNEHYATIGCRPISDGKAISYFDCENTNNVCLIGSYLNQKYYSDTSAVNKQIVANGKVYTIVGILAEVDGGQKWSEDNMIIAPYTNIAKKDNPESRYIFSAMDKSTIIQAKYSLQNLLQKYYSDTSVFNIEAMIDEINFAMSSINMLSRVLVGVAAISLFVGGIGIMNIMLISVSERVNEIGIRMAVGASEDNILKQFIIEAAAVSGFGGCLGVIIGCIISLIVTQIMSLELHISMLSIIISIGTSICTGILFGYIPARKASKMLPIDTLRQ